MTSYAIVADLRDASKFTDLQFANNSYKIQDLTHNNTCHAWGVRSQYADLWNTMKENDLIYFALQGDAVFKVACHVSHTEKNSQIASKIWGDDFRSKSMDHLIFLNDHVNDIILIDKSIRGLGLDPNNPGLFKLSLSHNELDPNDLLPIDLAGPPPKVSCNIIRFIRDTAKTRILKNKYNNQCQVCKYRISINNDRGYSEVHHIWPLHEGGDDDFNNMVVLCPTHHAEFDYAILGISENKDVIVNNKQEKICQIFMKAGHDISHKNILHHLKKMRDAK